MKTMKVFKISLRHIYKYVQDKKSVSSYSPKAPLFDLSGHEDKVLCCNWSNPKFMVSGGADNTVRIFKSKHIVR